jgi:hypothetical protein
MLSPDERTSFIQALLPPAGYRLDAAVGTSYSVDLSVITSILLGLAGAGEIDDPAKVNTPQLFSAFHRCSDRIAIFCNRGNIVTPALGQRLLKLYDSFLFDVRPEGGSFHPKLWVARYVPRPPSAGDSLYVLLCSSRNLTCSQNWEVLVRLEGRKTARRTRTTAVAEFLEHLLVNGRSLSKSRREMIRQLVEDLRSVEFEPPVGFHEWSFYGQVPGEGIRGALPKVADNVLLVSPFIDAAFIRGLPKDYPLPTVISTSSALDGLDEETLARFKPNETFVLDDANDQEDDNRLGLHAKLVVVDHGDTTDILMGSANATRRGWFGKNYEAMVLLRGSRYRIKSFLREFVYKDQGTNPWIQRYHRAGAEDPPEALEKKQMRDVQLGLTQLDIDLSYNPTELSLGMRIRQSPGPLVIPDNLVVSYHLFDLTGPATLTQAQLDAGVDQCYPNISPAMLSAFVAFSIQSNRSGQSRSFMLCAKNNFGNLAESRIGSVFNEIAREGSNLLALLRFVLFDILDVDPPTPHERHLPARRTKSSSGASRSALDGITLERVMKACFDDPAKIRDVNRIVSMLKPDSSDVQEFIEFWETFQEAYGQVR